MERTHHLNTTWYRLVLPDWRIQQVKQGKMKFHYSKAGNSRDSTLEQLVDSYYEKGGPYGSAWERNASTDYASVQESLVKMEDGGTGYQGDPPTPTVPYFEWTWQKISIPKLAMPRDFVRIILPVEDVKIVEPVDAAGWRNQAPHLRTIQEWYYLFTCGLPECTVYLWEYKFGSPIWV